LLIPHIGYVENPLGSFRGKYAGESVASWKRLVTSQILAYKKCFLFSLLNERSNKFLPRNK